MRQNSGHVDFWNSGHLLDRAYAHFLEQPTFGAAAKSIPYLYHESFKMMVQRAPHGSNDLESGFHPRPLGRVLISKHYICTCTAQNSSLTKMHNPPAVHPNQART